VSARGASPRPTDAPHFCKLAAHFLKDKRFDAAEGAAEIAASLMPKSFDAWFLLAVARARQEDRAGAAFAYLKALEIVPGHIGCWTDLGEIYVALLEYKKAAAALRQAMLLDPDAQHPSGRRARAVVGKVVTKLKKQVSA
jgi:cytochrome c-type biogenesis protein CcmH/NrfG